VNELAKTAFRHRPDLFVQTEGELVEFRGEITHAGGSLIFLRGTLKSGERTLFTYSRTIKRVKWKPRTDAAAIAS
jgi:hypothetical protein